MPKDKKSFGNKGEDLAAEFLTGKGYEIIERNYRYGKGEIDIIAMDNERTQLVFVEVKSRHNLDYGYPEEQISKGKQKQIRKIAEAYFYEKEIEGVDCRIDVVAILFQGNKAPYINHIENAF